MHPPVSGVSHQTPLLHSTFAAPPSAIVEYLLQAGSARTVLESLYSGAFISAVDRAGGSATLAAGDFRLAIPLDLLVRELPAIGRPISKSDTLQLTTEVCRTAGWHRCLDFLWINRNRPIFSTLYSIAADKVTQRCWVLSHALQILQHDAHVVALSSFLAMLAQFSTPSALEQHLEKVMGAPWEMTTQQADMFFRCTSPFELRPRKDGSLPGLVRCLRVADHADVYYPLRDWCFIAILCSAHTSLVWPGPDGPPAPFKS